MEGVIFRGHPFLLLQWNQWVPSERNFSLR
nr:MAG TPA: Paired amphipathic helix protein [Caudoviricetes sp.]